jgi:iron(III) transport system substrate-binding protein
VSTRIRVVKVLVAILASRLIAKEAAVKIIVLNRIVGSFTLLFLIIMATTLASAASPSVRQAKQEAEAKGYVFFTTHDEIVEGAKGAKEGRLRVFSGLEHHTFNPLVHAFRQKYPFITDIDASELDGVVAFQRFILEMKAGHAREWDVAHIPMDFAQEYPPYLKKYDILGMAKHGVLKIDPRMIYPLERNMVTITSNLSPVIYNKKLISDDKVPAKWEDFLKPEFKGRKFLMNLRSQHLAALVPAWGLDRTMDFARKLAAQQPAWGSGGTRLNTAITTGEHALLCCVNYSAARRSTDRDPTGSLNYKVVEPVPTRAVEHARAIFNTSAHPHSALLWLEFLASPEGQEIIDKHEPFRASVYSLGSEQARVTRGKELSVIDWNNFTKFQAYTEKIFAAWGFPKADRK